MIMMIMMRYAVKFDAREEVLRVCVGGWGQ